MWNSWYNAGMKIQFQLFQIISPNSWSKSLSPVSSTARYFSKHVLVCNQRSWKMHWKMHNGLSFCIVIISKWAIYDSTWTKSPNHICVFDLRKDVRTESFWGDGIQLVGKSLTPPYKTNKLEVSMGFHNKLPGFLSLSSFKWKHFLL